MSLLVEAAKVLLLAFLGQINLVADRGVATRFGDPGDPLDGDHMACTHERMEPGEMVCAHRTLACGTLVVLVNPRTGMFAPCRVLDRGPYGALLPSGEWAMKIRESDPGQWRGMIDLGPTVANALQLNGREKVWAVYQKPARRLFGRKPEEKTVPNKLATNLNLTIPGEEVD